jgi:predicted unusual protein kinase regulating ubiquinone biosynthesis (AarF/ABC1/UbiB family)
MNSVPPDDPDTASEGSRLGQRVLRYGRVGGTMAGLAARLAGEKFLGLQIPRDQHAGELTAALGALKGPLMKVGQILSTIPEALPPEYAREFQQLQANAPPMGWAFVKRRMRTELGPDWMDKFETFSEDAAAAASLGQVHRATTKDGQDVACKLQYPDMASAIDADLRQLKVIFSVFESYDRAIKTKYIHEELADRLYEELDYGREARACKLYAHMLRDEPSIAVPDVVDALSTTRLLTSTWLDGEKILNFKDAPTEQRNTLALTMFRAWYIPLYHYGVIHGDPHLGNYTVRKDLGINLLDFGCIRVFKPRFVGGVIQLYRALESGDEAQAVDAFETWGFSGLTRDQIDTLTIWAKFLYGPVLEDKVRPIGEVTNGVYGRETAQQVHEQLRKVGGVAVPREFVFMDRVALGLGSVFLHLKAEINWHRLFNELIDGFSTERLEAQQRETLPQFGFDSPE